MSAAGVRKVTNVFKRKWPAIEEALFKSSDDLRGSPFIQGDIPSGFQKGFTGPGRFDSIGAPQSFTDVFMRLPDGSIKLRNGAGVSTRDAAEAVIKALGDKITPSQANRIRLNAATKASQEKGIILRGADAERIEDAYVRTQRTRKVSNTAAVDGAADAVDDVAGVADDVVDATKKSHFQRAKSFFKNADPSGAVGSADSWMNNFVNKRWSTFKKAGTMGKIGMGLGAADLALMALPAGYDMFRGSKIGMGLLGDSESDNIQALLAQTKQQQLLKAYREATEQQRINQNAMALAREAPDLFEQVMAGRMLPQDGIAIGGRPRVDLLESVAQAMGTGYGVPQQQNPDELMNALMGGGVIQ